MSKKSKKRVSVPKETEDTFVPKSFKTRLAAALSPMLAGVGEGLSPKEKLRAQAAVLLAGARKQQAERDEAYAKVLTCVTLAYASKK